MRHNLFLVVREALNNIVKYARPTIVHVEIRVVGGGLRLAVADDGIGCDFDNPAPSGTHNGIGNMRRRIADVGGAIEFITGPGRGTRIEVAVPLPAAPLANRGRQA
jgi:NarL family two-component system sensor histidine kinase LiaS